MAGTEQERTPESSASTTQPRPSIPLFLFLKNSKEPPEIESWRWGDLWSENAALQFTRGTSCAAHTRLISFRFSSFAFRTHHNPVPNLVPISGCSPGRRFSFGLIRTPASGGPLHLLVYQICPRFPKSYDKSEPSDACMRTKLPPPECGQMTSMGRNNPSRRYGFFAAIPIAPRSISCPSGSTIATSFPLSRVFHPSSISRPSM